jgi:hypothetical protein
VYTFILFDTVSKYKAPEIKALPSLSNVGAVDLEPKYLSSKLSKAVRAAALAALAVDAEPAAAVAELDALVAEVDAADALEDAAEALDAAAACAVSALVSASSAAVSAV